MDTVIFFTSSKTQPLEKWRCLPGTWIGYLSVYSSKFYRNKYTTLTYASNQLSR